jgi:glycosyltransferase involved in cell wall biosynthesis
MAGGGAITILHGVLSLDVGGLERLVIGLIRVAQRAGHRVNVLCVERPGQLATEAEAAGAAVLCLRKPWGRHPEFIDKAGQHLRELRPDVVHTHQIGAAWYLGPAARALGIPVLHTEHGNQFARGHGWRKTVAARLLYRRAASFVGRFCCVSADIASAVTRWRTIPRAKVEVIPNGIETDASGDLPSPDQVRQSLGIPLGAPVVGTIGRLNEVKRQDLLIRAVAELRTTFPDIWLVLVGDGPERANLERLAAERGMADRVRFTGYQSCPEQFLRMMSVFALTSRSEGFPVSLLEAWAASVPVVCSAVGGIPALIAHGRNGLVFPAGDHEALVAALAGVLGDRESARRFGSAGRRTLFERYSLARVADEYERRYLELLSSQAGSR